MQTSISISTKGIILLMLKELITKQTGYFESPQPMSGSGASQGYGSAVSMPITDRGMEVCPVSTWRCAMSLPTCLESR